MRIYIRKAWGFLSCQSGVDWNLMGTIAELVGYIHKEEHTAASLSLELLTDPVKTIGETQSPEEPTVTITTSDDKEHVFYSARQLNAWVQNTFGHLEQPAS